MSGATPFVIQFTEALSAISIPIGGGLAAYAKWKRGTERDRKAREDAARISAEKAAASARREEQLMRDALLAEKDTRIHGLEETNKDQAEELERLRAQIERMYNNSGGSGQH